MLTVRQFCFNPLMENTYLLYNEAGEAVIIDPGCYTQAEEKQLAGFIEQHQLQPKWLLNTHCHLDHVFGNRFVHEKWKLVPYIHAREQPVHDRAEEAGQRWNLPFRKYDGSFHYIKESDKVGLPGDELTVIEAPGHSPGHVCFYKPDQHFVVGGDVLFKRSIGRTDLPGGNHQQLINSIRKALLVLPATRWYIPGIWSPPRSAMK
ncbi:MAG: MBL fold metallo-hydrolase [Flavihumibacter sp.]